MTGGCAGAFLASWIHHYLFCIKGSIVILFIDRVCMYTCISYKVAIGRSWFSQVLLLAVYYLVWSSIFILVFRQKWTLISMVYSDDNNDNWLYYMASYMSNRDFNHFSIFRSLHCMKRREEKRREYIGSWQEEPHDRFVCFLYLPVSKYLRDSKIYKSPSQSINTVQCSQD